MKKNINLKYLFLFIAASVLIFTTVKIVYFKSEIPQNKIHVSSKTEVNQEISNQEAPLIVHSMTPEEILKIIRAEPSDRDEEKVQMAYQEKAKYQYCKVDSDCVAMAGVKGGACIVVNKNEIELWRKADPTAGDCSVPYPIKCSHGSVCRQPYPFPVDPGMFIFPTGLTEENVLLGASHNVFIARIIKQTGEKDLGSGPETQFKVEVISNIKGDLHGTVTVDQIGGYKNGILYTVSDDNPDPKAKKSNESYFLQEGNTYLLATRYNETEDWYTINSFYTARKLLSTDKNMNPADLKALADNDERVKVLKEAYPKEKLLDADISHGNTKNSFVSLSEEEQEKIKNELKTIE
jgi:hypothetical protein